MKSVRSLLVRIYVEVRDETAFLAALADYTGRHGLAASAAQLNRDTEGDSSVLSMVALIEADSETGEPDAGNTEKPGKIKPTFRIVPGPPEGQSYAIDLARRYGISRDQLIATLEQRGALAADSRAEN